MRRVATEHFRHAHLTGGVREGFHDPPIAVDREHYIDCDPLFSNVTLDAVEFSVRNLDHECPFALYASYIQILLTLVSFIVLSCCILNANKVYYLVHIPQCT